MRNDPHVDHWYRLELHQRWAAPALPVGEAGHLPFRREAQVVVDVPSGQRATARRRVVERRAGLRHVHRGTDLFPAAAPLVHAISEERRVGNACVSTSMPRWSEEHYIKNKNKNNQ